MIDRTPVKEKAKQLIKHLKKENPDYIYLREIFKQIRKDLKIEVNKAKVEHKLPYVPTEEEISLYYNTVWASKNMNHVLIIKTLLYTGVKVSELINIKIEDVDLENYQIKIAPKGKKKSRLVPFPISFREVLAIHIENNKKKGAKYLFESNRKKKYSDRGIRKMLITYTKIAGIERSISPNTLRHFLFTWMKKKGVEDALIQSYSGHESSASLEKYSQLGQNLPLDECQSNYEQNIKNFPI